MSLLYKILFEVKLMHEYFLTRPDGQTPFPQPGQAQRMNFLQTEFADSRESIDRDIAYCFPEELKTIYDNHGLVLLPAYSGFRVVIRVNEKKLPDNSIVYEPFIPLPQSRGIVVLLLRKNTLFNSYTNYRLQTSIPATSLFANEPMLNNATPPFLTGAIPPFDATRSYEQGELAFSGGNLQEFFRNDAGDQWAPVAGTRFANENDRLLVGTRFDYTISPPSIKEAEFVLKNKDAEIIKSIAVEANTEIERTRLDFSDVEESVVLNPDLPLTDSVFTLEVNGPGNFSRSHKIIFSNSLLRESPWAVVYIQPTTTQSAYDLLAPDGFLKHRVDTNGNVLPAPTFEIPVKSRSTYWRYSNNRGHELQLASDLQGYLEKKGGQLVSIKPKAVSQSNLQMKKDDETASRHVPNPIDYTLRSDSLQRLFFDIRVAESELFPVV